MPGFPAPLNGAHNTILGRVPTGFTGYLAATVEKEIAERFQQKMEMQAKEARENPISIQA
ncbi:hypothetical protein E8E95_21905 [Pseudomonas sp. BN414]|nr:hypothetical protein [Pseudomonas sp. BN414]